MSDTIYRPQPRFDLLSLPIIGRWLKWRWGRLSLQLTLLAVALLLVYDGFSGPQLAPNNLATVVTWVHYRGFVVFGFLFLGNLFCMGCPFTLPRSLAKRIAISGRRWPKQLRNKWVAIALLFLFFFLYEWLDLWASPWITAWVIVGYFLSAFLLETFFAESPFCKYVCPLGSFNYLSSTISPLQITVAEPATCKTCVGRECINGSTPQPGNPVMRSGQLINADQIQVLGCGTELFAPQIQSNLDCTFCLDCARACPHDNVVLGWRSPLAEVTRQSWPQRWDINFLMLVFAFASLSNAFGMVPPIFALEVWLSEQLGTTNEAILLGLIFGTSNLLLPIAMGVGVAWLSRQLSGRAQIESLRITLSRYVPAFAPLTFAIWLAHYGGFHFLSSAGTIVPTFQNFMLDHRISWFGDPNYAFGPILPINWLDPLELVFVIVGLLTSLYVLGERARLAKPKRDSAIAQLPWMLLLVGIALAAIWIFFLPMEMRGTVFAP